MMRHSARCFAVSLVSIVFTIACTADSTGADPIQPRIDAAAQDEGDLGEALARRMPEVRLESVPLIDVIEWLREVSGVNIFVRWRPLEGVGIDRSVPVSLQVRDVPFRTVLRLVLEDASFEADLLGFDVDPDNFLLIISTAEDLAERPPQQKPMQAAHAVAPAAPVRGAHGEYYIVGVERSGTYTLTDRPITLRQALISAGAAEDDRHLVLVRRDLAGGASRTMVVPLRRVLGAQIAPMNVESGDVLMVVDEPPALRPPSYNVAGDVPAPGDYQLSGRRINLLQALVIAGANPAAIGETEVVVHRVTGDDERIAYKSKVIDLIYHADGGIALEHGDHVVVGDADAPPRRP